MSGLDFHDVKCCYAFGESRILMHGSKIYIHNSAFQISSSPFFSHLPLSIHLSIYVHLSIYLPFSLSIYVQFRYNCMEHQKILSGHITTLKKNITNVPATIIRKELSNIRVNYSIHTKRDNTTASVVTTAEAQSTFLRILLSQ